MNEDYDVYGLDPMPAHEELENHMVIEQVHMGNYNLEEERADYEIDAMKEKLDT